MRDVFGVTSPTGGIGITRYRLLDATSRVFYYLAFRFSTSNDAYRRWLLSPDGGVFYNPDIQRRRRKSMRFCIDNATRILQDEVIPALLVANPHLADSWR